MNPFNGVDAALLWLRVALGALVFALHGWARLTRLYNYLVLGKEWTFVSLVEKMGFPMPVAFAVASSLAESIGAILLILGFYTRWAAVILAFNMAVATWFEFSKGGTGAELPGVYLIAIVAIVVAGPAAFPWTRGGVGAGSPAPVRGSRPREAARKRRGGTISKMASTYHGRRAATIENEHLRITVLEEGGHIAEILHKATGLNPLWTPPWRSIEPSAFRPDANPGFGSGSDARLLAGIMGHNLCLDLFGGPSAEEQAAGVTAHGESSVARYGITETRSSLILSAQFPLAQLAFERNIQLAGSAVRIRESVENLTAADRPLAWTQHVTLGPPFLEKGKTLFRASATRSKVYESGFGSDDYLATGAEFDWPLAPRKTGGHADLRTCTAAPKSSAYTTHLLDGSLEDAFFLAWLPAARLAFGYGWKRADFPWLGIWEENHSRTHSPWNGATLTRGMEFGASPMPESRREMVERGRLFGTPTYRWLPARGRVEVEYWAAAWVSDSVPESIERHE